MWSEQIVSRETFLRAPTGAGRLFHVKHSGSAHIGSAAMFHVKHLARCPGNPFQYNNSTNQKRMQGVNQRICARGRESQESGLSLPKPLHCWFVQATAKADRQTTATMTHDRGPPGVSRADCCQTTRCLHGVGLMVVQRRQEGDCGPATNSFAI